MAHDCEPLEGASTVERLNASDVTESLSAASTIESLSSMDTTEALNGAYTIEALTADIHEICREPPSSWETIEGPVWETIEGPAWEPIP